MTLLTAARYSTLAAALAFCAPASADTCSSILDSLSKKADELAKRDAKGAALCAGMGQLFGLMQAGKIVAEQCEHESAKDLAESTKGMEEGIAAQCK